MIPDTVIRRIKRAKVFTIMQLADWLSCSVPTARRRLKHSQAYTSYNHNGRYYTLPQIPDFDPLGLWGHRGISFSRHGNLKQTLVHLVTHSDSGLTASELEAIVGLRARSFLSHFRNHPQLRREKVKGRFVWFAADDVVRKEQMKSRMAREAQKASGLPSDSEAVLILVDLIRHPDTSIQQMAQRLRRHGTPIDREAICRLLVHHSLLKKNSDLPRSGP